MTQTIEKAISEYEAAKSDLDELFSTSSTLNDNLIDAHDKEIQIALEQLLSAQTVDDAGSATRIRYLLLQIKTSKDVSSLVIEMIKTIESDLEVLVSSNSHI